MTGYLSTLFDLLNILGTIAFAISGSLLAMEKRCDFFGVIFIACVTATGGGVLRDLVLGDTPPAAIMQPRDFTIAMFIGAMTFFLAGRLPARGERLFLYSDALGLGAFTALGASKALAVPNCNIFLVAITGLLTGVGGGMLRDILAREVPCVLRREVYATASVAGACALYMARGLLDMNAAGIFCLLVTCTIRLVALHNKLEIPRASLRKPGSDV